MLECKYSEEVIDALWQKLGCRIDLSGAGADFFDLKGAEISTFSTQRQFNRYLHREKALLIHRGSTYAIYTKDISSSSVGFLHADQLFPLENVRLFLANGGKIDVTIRRCVRLQESCYECGAEIDSTDRMTTKQLRELLQTRI
jgi:hypothetical protein